MPRDLTVLVGNGLSIAFNPGLALDQITSEVIQRFSDSSAEGDDVIAALIKLAERAVPSSQPAASDFEKLVGALGAETKLLDHLQDLAAAVDPDDDQLLKAIRATANFAERVRDTGVSHVLEIIYERARGSHDKAEDLHALVKATIEAFDGRVTFGNLNYDTLLLSALLRVCEDDLADMAHGANYLTVIVKGGTDFKVNALRRSDDFPTGRRVRLVHLHGSLTYWGNRSRNLYGKLTTNDLDMRRPWANVREERNELRPCVVLVSQSDKVDSVSEYPFNLAYKVLSSSLDNSNFWLIIGYSFRDEPVNAALREVALARESKPKVLVITHGELPSLEEVERAFGWGAEDGDSSGWLQIDRDGADGAEEREPWTDFSR